MSNPDPAPEPITGIFSMVLGVVLGYGIAYAFQKLKRSSVSGSTNNEDFKSEEGIVMLPISGQQRGKIRVSTANGFHDIIAITRDKSPLKRGQRVLIVSVEDGIANVSRISAKNRALQASAEEQQQN